MTRCHEPVESSLRSRLSISRVRPMKRRVLPMKTASSSRTAPLAWSTGRKLSGSAASRVVGARQGLAVEHLGHCVRSRSAAAALARGPRAPGSLERAEEDGRGAALLRREVGVAAAHGEPVGLAHDRAAPDLDRHVEVGHQAPDHGELLRVLLAEVGAIRRRDLEQLHHHRRDAAEVAGAPLALERQRPRSRRRSSSRRRPGTSPRPPVRRADRSPRDASSAWSRARSRG